MKLIRSVIACLLFLAAFAAHARTIEMEVNGLVCAFCAQGIEKTFKARPETEGVVVSLEHRLVAVKLKDGSDITDEVLRKTLTDSGYTVVAIQRTERSLDEIRQATTRRE
jgi:cation transport ATPase